MGISQVKRTPLSLEKWSKTAFLFQEEIVINAQTLTKGLQALKTEHESLLKGVDSGKSEKATLLEKSLEMIDLGLGEAHVMVALASHLQVCRHVVRCFDRMHIFY